MNYILLLVALALSAVAAYYSIAGLVAIFAAAVVPIIVMGGTLEVAKLVVASWLYRNWKEVPMLMKTYFSISLIVLMTLTSMGIFGFLSKAHLDQAVPTADVAAKLSIIDEKIKTEKDTINESRQIIAQLDSQVNQTISRTSADTTTKGIDRSIQIRKQQYKERKQLSETISTSQSNIAKLNEERAPISSELRKVEAEVGPVKYIAALIYGDNPDQNVLEKAVRIVILMIVSVFDPLAVLMLVAANWSMKKRKEEEPKPEVALEQFTKDFVDNQIQDNTPFSNEELWRLYGEDFPDVEDVEEKVEWPEDESRIETIGPNGNDGLHYDEIYKDWDPVFDKVDEQKSTVTINEVEPEQPKKTLGRFLQELAERNAKLKNTTIEEEVDKIQESYNK